MYWGSSNDECLITGGSLMKFLGWGCMRWMGELVYMREEE